LTNNHILTVGEKAFAKTGNYCDPQITEMLSLKMLKGTRAGLKEPYSILLSESVAKIYFGDADPLDKIIKLDNKDEVKVTGVYEDLPYNSTFRSMTFILPWELFEIHNPWLKNAKDLWSDNFTLTYARIADHADMEDVSAKIKDLIITRVDEGHAKNKPAVFLQPMSRWHLYAQFKNGVNTGGRIESVWLFGIIGIFVLLLACINFMNLSTARSEKRAKEVGIRKTIGSVRSQLISQFFSESLLVVAFAFMFSLLIVVLVLPAFNELAGKKISVLWSSPVFWFSGIGFSIITGMIAGFYPALYLSSFQPVKVLKGTFRAGRFASVPRKVLVVLQFAVSIILIVGTIVVFKQIQFSKNRPVGYNREGLIIIETATGDLHNHFNAVREDLLKSGAITEVAQSSSPTTAVNNSRSDVEWNGKDPAMTDDFANIRVTPGYGKTVGWQFTDGRDFSGQFLTDSSSVIVNEAAVKYMGLENPVGETIRFAKKDYTIIGVIKNMVMESPYKSVKQTIFYIPKRGFEYVIIKINPRMSTHEAIRKIEPVCKAYSPSVPFTYRFADEEYARKFSDEERIGKLVTFFAILAISISCIGLFGMASFMAAQRTKEIGVRKILGASVITLWRMLSGEFVSLVIISLFVAIPVAYYFLTNWLQKYEYRTEIAWWVFAIAGAGALVITLLTVSYQSVKAALANPVKSLRSE
jgi:ABC-type antimicrobial peptide transport system permease subunit